MKISPLFKSAVAVIALSVGAQSLHAANQTWTNAAGGDWNTSTNWTSAVPAVGDNATLTSALGNYTVDYSAAMSAASIASLTLSNNTTRTATLNVAATGFNLTGGLSIATGGVFNVNTGGNATVGTGISMAGGAFTLNGGTLSSGGDFSMAQSPTIVTPSVVTINSGTLTMTNSGVGRLKFGGYSRSSSFTINGGTVNINSIQTGDTSALNITSGILNVVGSGGGIDLGGASGNLGGALSMTISGGTVNNLMALTVGSLTGRQATLTMSGGTFTQGNGDNVYIGKAATQDAGIFNFSGGTFHNSMGLIIGAAAYTGTAGTFEGTLNQSGGTWTNDKAVTLGWLGTAKLAISGGNFTAHSASNNATVTVGAAGVLGNLTLSGTGNMTVDGLVATSGANSTVSFTGGTLNTKATTIANGSVFTVGNGTSAATLVMNGGTHSFADGLAISNNATLSGNGTVTGNAAVTGNGIINLTSGSISGTLGVTGGNWNGVGSVTGAVTSSSGTLAIGNGANLTASSGLNVTGGTISAGNSTSTITGSINYTSSSNSTFAGVIAGSTKTVTLNNAAAVLTLSGTNSYTGATTVTAGTLVLAGGGSIGNGTVAVNGGQFTVNGAVGNGGVTVANGATLGGNGTIAGAVSIASGGTLAPGNSPGTLTVASSIWNDGGNYNWQLYNATGSAGSAYDTIASSGNLNLSSLTAGGFKINLWTLSGTNASSGSAINFDSNGSYSWSLASFGSITGFNAANFTINTSATNGTTGFANSFMAGGFKVTTNGSGQLLLTYQGASPVWTGGSGNLSTIGTTNGSALVFTGSGGNVTNNAQVSSLSSMTFSNGAGTTTFSGSALTNGSGGIVNNSTATQTVSLPLTLGANQSFDAASGNLAISGNVTNNGNTLTLAGASNTTVSGNISGTGGVTKTNAGTATLSGNNTYSGASTVNGGTLVAGSSTALGSGAALTVNNGSTLALASYNSTVGAVTLNSGSITGSGTLTGTSYAVSSGTIAPILAGAGVTLTKSGAGSVTLNAAETFTGKTTVSAGTLILASGASLASTEINLGTSGQGTLTATGGITIRSGQTLAGYGTVEGNTTIASGATLAPGNSPGIINIAGDLTLKSGSTSIFEVVGSGIAGAAFDQVSVTGVLTYGGVLNLAIAGNYSATAPFKGLLFDIQSGSQTGAFSQVQYKLNTGVWKDLYYYSDINTWQMWDNTAIANLADNGYVGINLNTGVLTVVPEPSTWALVVGGVSTLVILRRRN